MKLTWQDISKIVRLYEAIEHDDNESASDWCMDEDNTGIAYPYLSHEEMCKMVLQELDI